MSWGRTSHQWAISEKTLFHIPISNQVSVSGRKQSKASIDVLSGQRGLGGGEKVFKYPPKHSTLN